MNGVRQALEARQEQRRRRLATGALLLKTSTFTEFTKQQRLDLDNFGTEFGDQSTPPCECDTNASGRTVQVCTAERQALAALRQRFPTASYLGPCAGGKSDMCVAGVMPSQRKCPARRWHQPLPWMFTLVTSHQKGEENPEREHRDVNARREEPHHGNGDRPGNTTLSPPTPPPRLPPPNPHFDEDTGSEHHLLLYMANVLQGLEEEMARTCKGARPQQADDKRSWRQLWAMMVEEVLCDIQFYVDLAYEPSISSNKLAIPDTHKRGRCLEQKTERQAVLHDGRLLRLIRNGQPLMRVWRDVAVGKATASDLLHALVIHTRLAEEERSEETGASSGSGLAGDGDTDAELLLSGLESRHRPRWSWILQAYEEGKPGLDLVLTHALCGLVACRLCTTDSMDQDPLLLAATNACYLAGKELSNAHISPHHIYTALDSWPLPWDRVNIVPRGDSCPMAPKRFSSRYLHYLTTEVIRIPAAVLAWTSLFNQCRALGLHAGNVRNVLNEGSELVVDVIAAEIFEFLKSLPRDSRLLGTEQEPERRGQLARTDVGSAAAQSALDCWGGGGHEGAGAGVGDEATRTLSLVDSNPAVGLKHAAPKQCQEFRLLGCGEASRFLQGLGDMAFLWRAGGRSLDVAAAGGCRIGGSNRRELNGDGFPGAADTAAGPKTRAVKQELADQCLQFHVSDMAELTVTLLSMGLDSQGQNGYLVFQPGGIPQIACKTSGQAAAGKELSKSGTTRSIDAGASGEALSAAAAAVEGAPLKLVVCCINPLPKSGTPGYDWNRIRRAVRTVRAGGNLDAVIRVLLEALLKKNLRLVLLQAQGMKGVMGAVHVLAKIRQEMLGVGRDLCASVRTILDIGDRIDFGGEDEDDFGGADGDGDGDNDNYNDTQHAAISVELHDGTAGGAGPVTNCKHACKSKRPGSSSPQETGLDFEMELLEHRLSQFFSSLGGEDEVRHRLGAEVCLERMRGFLAQQARPGRHEFVLELVVHECGVGAPWQLVQPEGAKMGAVLAEQQRQVALKLKKAEELHRALFGM